MQFVVEWLTCWDQLLRYAETWNRLAGCVPFRRWEWLAGWWRHYGQPTQGQRSLFVGLVKDPSGEVIGLAPWYLQRSAFRGRVIRFLGDGEVCSDHLSILCQSGQESRVVEALAQSLLASLTGPSGQPDSLIHRGNNGMDWAANGISLAEGSACPGSWHLLELADVDSKDPAVEALAKAMAKRGCWVDRTPAGHCWVIELPPTWEAFLQMLSRSHRIRLRRIDKRFFATGRAVFHTVSQPEQLPGAMDLLVALHRQRRRHLGQPDCFVSSRFETFHRQLAPELLAAGLLELHWLEVDGQPVAAEYHLRGDKTIYAYQSGMAPSEQCPSPGEWLHMATIRRAIEIGYREFDFLRGDEPYKAHWRAQPRPAETFWIVAPHTAAHWRYGFYRTARRLNRWLRRWLGRNANPLAPSGHSASEHSAELPEVQVQELGILEQAGGRSAQPAALLSAIPQEPLEQATSLSAKDVD